MAVKDKSVVCLTPEQRQEWERMGRSGTHAARTLIHARTLLMSDDGDPDESVAEAVGVHINTVARIRKLFARGGLGAASVWAAAAKLRSFNSSADFRTFHTHGRCTEHLSTRWTTEKPAITDVSG